MNNLISPDVLKLESKNPDYIYLKYHIYKESMERRKYKELESQVNSSPNSFYFYFECTVNFDYYYSFI